MHIAFEEVCRRQILIGTVVFEDRLTGSPIAQNERNCRVKEDKRALGGNMDLLLVGLLDGVEDGVSG